MSDQFDEYPLTEKDKNVLTLLFGIPNNEKTPIEKFFAFLGVIFLIVIIAIFLIYSQTTPKNITIIFFFFFILISILAYSTTHKFN